MTRRPVVLVVEDSDDAREMYVTYLASRGYKVSSLSTGQTVLHAARLNRPDAIVLDVALPGKSGFTVCRQLRSDPATARIPIVIISALAPNLQSQALGAGASKSLTKPCTPDVLEATIREFLDLGP